MAEAKIQTGLRIDETLYKKILAVSQIQRRSLNAQIEYILDLYTRDFEKLSGPLEEWPGSLEMPSDRDE